MRTPWEELQRKNPDDPVHEFEIMRLTARNLEWVCAVYLGKEPHAKKKPQPQNPKAYTDEAESIEQKMQYGWLDMVEGKTRSVFLSDSELEFIRFFIKRLLLSRLKDTNEGEYPDYQHKTQLGRTIPILFPEGLEGNSEPEEEFAPQKERKRYNFDKATLENIRWAVAWLVTSGIPESLANKFLADTATWPNSPQPKTTAELLFYKIDRALRELAELGLDRKKITLNQAELILLIQTIQYRLSQREHQSKSNAKRKLEKILEILNPPDISE